MISSGVAPSVARLLASALESERISYVCEACGHDGALLRHAVSRLPRGALVVHLKRFGVDASGHVAKDVRRVDVSTEVDLAPLLENDDVINDGDERFARTFAFGFLIVPRVSSPAPKRTRLSARYRLVAMISHEGASALSGHYVCDVRDEKTSSWICFNDDWASDAGDDALALSQRRATAYLLAYVPV